MIPISYTRTDNLDRTTVIDPFPSLFVRTSMTSLPFLAQSLSDSDSDSDDSNDDNKNNNSNSNDTNHNNPNARRMDLDLDSSTFRIVPRPQDCDSLLRGAQKNDPQLCRDLITLLNVPPSYGNAIGQTALHVAVLWGHIEAAEVRTFDKIKVRGRGIVIIIIYYCYKPFRKEYYT